MVSVTASFSSKTFVLEGSKLMLALCPADSRILCFWYVLKSTHKFIIEHHALQYLFVGWSNKKQRRGRIISNFTKRDTFLSLTYINQVTILLRGPPSCTLSKRVFLSFSVWARREYIQKLNWKKSLQIYFQIWQVAPCSHRQSRNRMMNTFI